MESSVGHDDSHAIAKDIALQSMPPSDPVQQNKQPGSPLFNCPTRAASVTSLARVIVSDEGNITTDPPTARKAAEGGNNWKQRESELHKDAPTIPANALGIVGKEDAIEGEKSYKKLAGGTQASSSELDQASGFWTSYNKAADFEDREFVKAAGGNLDTLLIFAALFSAINTTVIVESIKDIQPDPMTATNNLLHTIELVLQNKTSNDPECRTPWSPPVENVRCTAVFFASLACSLAAAFGAVLGKQWLNHYEREGILKPAASRGRERQRKYQGRVKWHLEGVIETLPTLLQLSLFLFLGALVDFLWPISKVCAMVVLGFTVAIFVFFLVTTTIATVFPLAPFQTRLSATIRTVSAVVLAMIIKGASKSRDRLRGASWNPFKRDQASRLLHPYPEPQTNLKPDEPSTVLDIKCLVFYAERASTTEDFKDMLAGMDALPTDLVLDAHHPALASLGETLLKFVIKPTGQGSEASSPLPPEDFRLLLKPLRLLYSSWKYLDRPSQHPASSDYYWRYAALVCRKLWECVALDPHDPVLHSLVADIFDLPLSIGGSYADQCGDHATVCKYLISALLQNPYDPRPARLLIHALGGQDYARVLQDVDNSKLVLTLISRLDPMRDIEPTKYSEWDESLLDHRERQPIDLEFSKYLLKRVKSYANNAEAMPNPVAILWRQLSSFLLGSCLVAMHKVLQGNPEDPSWLKLFEDTEVPNLLLGVMRQDVQNSNVVLSLFTFVSLWQIQAQAPEGHLRPSYPYLTSSSVANIVRRLMLIQAIEPHHFKGIEGRQVAQCMQHVVEFLEESSRLQLLERGLQNYIVAYKGEGYCHSLVERETLTKLYERLDNLVYTE